MSVVYTVIAFIFFAFGVVNGSKTLASTSANQMPAERGGSANITCDGITNYQRSKLYFNGTKVTEKPGKLEQMPNGAYLIKDVQLSDTGKYQYREISVDSKYRNHCVVMLYINEETITVKPGSTATILCKVGVPVADRLEKKWRKKDSSGKISWLVKNGLVTKLAKKMFSGRLTASFETLTISNSTESDSGNYTCIVVTKVDYQLKLYHTNLVVKISSGTMTTTGEGISYTPSSEGQPTKGVTNIHDSAKSCAIRLSGIFVAHSFIIEVSIYWFLFSIIAK